MKIVLWIGNGANQKALANKIHQEFPIAGIIVENRKQSRKLTLSKLVEKGVEKVFLGAIPKAWWAMQNKYNDRYPNYPDTRILEVENINSDEAFAFTNEINPDLIIVSGTRLVKEKMLSIKPGIGILNLHTGLSPYIKGGPNCTNWCIATKQFHLIGNTVMWIDIGIDSGNILATGFTGFEGNESLDKVHIKVMEHAHDLYLSSIRYLAGGNFKSVKQSDIAKGTTYYTRSWTLKQKINLIRNMPAFRKSILNGETRKKQQTVRIEPL